MNLVRFALFPVSPAPPGEAQELPVSGVVGTTPPENGTRELEGDATDDTELLLLPPLFDPLLLLLLLLLVRLLLRLLGFMTEFMTAAAAAAAE